MPKVAFSAWLMSFQPKSKSVEDRDIYEMIERIRMMQQLNPADNLPGPLSNDAVVWLDYLHMLAAEYRDFGILFAAHKRWEETQ